MSKGTLIHGCAATEHLDSSGERLIIKGIDISSLESGTGTLNWEHKNDDASQTVGKIVKAKKIFSEADCEDSHQLKFWNRFKVPFLYIIGELFDGVGHEKAKDVAAMIRYDSQKRAEGEKVPNVINFSIEGSKLEKVGNEIVKSIARKTTLTVTPCNKAAIAEEFQPAKKAPKDDSIFSKSEAFEIDILEKADLFKPSAPKPGSALSTTPLAAKPTSAPVSNKPVFKPTGPMGGVQIGQTKSNKPIFSHAGPGSYGRGFSPQDHHDAGSAHFDMAQQATSKEEATHHLNHMKMHFAARDRADNIKQIRQRRLAAKPFGKTLTAGGGDSAPSARVGMAALSKENLDGAAKSWSKYGDTLKFITEAKPQLDKSEAELLAKYMAFRAMKRAEKALAKMSGDDLSKSRDNRGFHASIYSTKDYEKAVKHLNNAGHRAADQHEMAHELHSKGMKHMSDKISNMDVDQYDDFVSTHLDPVDSKMKKAVNPKLMSDESTHVHPKWGKVKSVHKYKTDKGTQHTIEIMEGEAKGKWTQSDEKDMRATGSDLEKSKNVREQRKKVFGTDANAPRVSEKRMKMMQRIRDYVQDKYGMNLETAQGKRDKEGQLREEADLAHEPFDVFTPEGHAAETKRNKKLKQRGEKRTDPKPHWIGDTLETQPSPDAAIHETAHLDLAPEGRTPEQFQLDMDAAYARHGKEYGHAQGKRTAWEVQPMSIENPIRREIGLPANRTTKEHLTPEQIDKLNAQRTKRKLPDLETDPETGVELTFDDKRPRFHRGTDDKYYDRQSRLQSPETKERVEAIRSGTLKFHPSRGWYRADDSNALVNLRGQGKQAEATQRLKGKYNKSEDLQKAAKVNEFNPEEHHGKKVFVYFNLHNKHWSVKHNGKVIGHAKEVHIDNPEFRVSEAGRQRVLSEGVKNVHAGVVGTVNARPEVSDSEKKRISYNPRKAAHFVEKETGNPVHGADTAHMVVEEKDGARIPHVHATNLKSKEPIEKSDSQAKRNQSIKQGLSYGQAKKLREQGVFSHNKEKEAKMQESMKRIAEELANKKKA